MKNNFLTAEVATAVLRIVFLGKWKLSFKQDETVIQGETVRQGETVGQIKTVGQDETKTG